MHIYLPDWPSFASAHTTSLPASPSTPPVTIITVTQDLVFTSPAHKDCDLTINEFARSSFWLIPLLFTTSASWHVDTLAVYYLFFDGTCRPPSYVGLSYILRAIFEIGNWRVFASRGRDRRYTKVA